MVGKFSKSTDIYYEALYDMQTEYENKIETYWALHYFHFMFSFILTLVLAQMHTAIRIRLFWVACIRTYTKEFAFLFAIL